MQPVTHWGVFADGQFTVLFLLPLGATVQSVEQHITQTRFCDAILGKHYKGLLCITYGCRLRGSPSKERLRRISACQPEK